MARFLIVEDEPGVGKFLITLLSGKYKDDQFDLATDFFEAVKILAEAKSDSNPINGCLSDFNYSGAADEDAVRKGRPNGKGQGGLDLLEHVKGDPLTHLDGKYPEISFAFMSGYGHGIKQAIEARGFTIGDDHVLQKPCKNQALYKIIDHLREEAAAGGSPGAPTPNRRLLIQVRVPAI